MKIKTALILCAGFGKRLHPMTLETPKPNQCIIVSGDAGFATELGSDWTDAHDFFYLWKVKANSGLIYKRVNDWAQAAIEKYADESKMPYVTERWLGGTLTNFRTIRERLKRLIELEGLIESGEIKSYSKKMESQLMREKNKIYRNLNGIRDMSNLPGAMVVVDVNREKNALNEAKNLGIPTICLIDTDGDPDLADIPIPGNDDSMRSIDVVIRELCASIADGKAARATNDGGRDREEGDAPSGNQRRRSNRSQFKAEEPAPEAIDADPTNETTEAPAATTSADAPSS